MEKVKIQKSFKKAEIMRAIKPWLFVLPAAIILCAVLIIPILKVFQFSFLDRPYVNKTPDFIWFDNYTAVLQNAKFWPMIKFTAIFTLGSVILHVAIGLCLAMALNSKINKKALTVFRVMFILPWVFTAAVVALIWQLMMSTQGVFNSLLGQMFGETVLIEWLGNPSIVVISLLIINAWRGYPHCMISFLAGLQNISPALYEAASVDGATKVRQFFSITIPQLMPVISSVSLLDAIWTMNLFPLIWLTTGGGPNGATETIATWVYRLSFDQLQFGQASALAIIGLILTMIVTVFYLKAQKKIG